MNRVDGKVALLSGAARGIGAESAMVLAKGGAKVVITDLLEERGHETVERIRAAGGDARFYRHDVTVEAEWQHVVDETVRHYGGIDVLVNNAGLFIAEPTETMSYEAYRKLCAVNLDGVWMGTKIAGKAMKESAKKSPFGGSIINLSSVAGLVGSALAASYNLTKGGVRLFTKGTAMEYAPFRIRVNSVHPGVIQTDMGQQVFDTAVAFGWAGGDNEARETMTNLHPIGRLGVPMDIANAISFLASDDSSFITGTELVVDGGMTAS